MKVASPVNWNLDFVQIAAMYKIVYNTVHLNWCWSSVTIDAGPDARGHRQPEGPPGEQLSPVDARQPEATPYQHQLSKQSGACKQ